jgi:hypothetical protein
MFMERRAVFAELRDRLIVIGYLQGLADSVYSITLAFSFFWFSSHIILFISSAPCSVRMQSMPTVND